MQPPPTTHLAKESPYSDRYCPLESPVSSTSALHGSAGKLMLKRMCSISSRRVSTFICKGQGVEPLLQQYTPITHETSLLAFLLPTCARAFCTRRYERQRCASHTKRMRATAHPSSVTAAQGDTLQAQSKSALRSPKRPGGDRHVEPGRSVPIPPCTVLCCKCSSARR